MQQIKRKLSALFLLGFALAGVQAQVVIPKASGNTTGTGGFANCSTVGQIVYTTNIGISSSVVQDEQELIEISSIVRGIEDSLDISLQCTIYPNPTTDFLTLKIESELQGQYFASLYDMSGKLLGKNIIEGNETKIDMHNLVSANYFLKISDNKKRVKIFKIIKN